MARDRSADVAVTGMAGRFPGARDIDELWSAVTAGQVLTTRLSREELAGAGVPADQLDDPDYVPYRGLLADSDRFDNALFRFSARDAQLMDPQHRLMLEAAWAALEDAGRDPLGESVVTGVYASDSGSGYLRAMLSAAPLDPQTLDQALHGTEPDFIASLVSYKLDLTGPAIGVRTACSSSLVGLHLAIQALLAGDCDQALVVAAGIDYPQAGHVYVPGGIQSARGFCRPFDAAADGVLAGSGVAAVVLRRLADALEDGIAPHGVVLGTAVNNDGAAKAGYYAPSVAGQEAVITAALETAGVSADSIGYLETHGTGTRLGDPIEWSAASSAYRSMGARPGQVAVGALKANIGHLDSAAGLAALIKALLVVRHGVVPPLAGFTAPNPLLEVRDSPLFVPAGPSPWHAPAPRRAAVSSFGIGGTNVHLVVEQPPEPAPAEPAPAERAADGDHLVLLSAADPGALDRAAERLARHLAGARPDLADVSRTLADGRAELPARLAVCGRTSADVARRLARGDAVVRGERPVDGPAAAVFLFPGQGTQSPGMARSFNAALPGFPAALDDALAAFPEPLSARLRRCLLDEGFPADDLAATELAQPALFAVEYAAATALGRLGIHPAGLVGHSVGEIAAACVAGVFDLADAARFVTARGAAMQRCPAGAMIALGCDEPTALAWVAESDAGLELAAVNSPADCVLAGPPQEVARFRDWLADRVFSRILRTRHAFHTSLVEPALGALAEELAAITLHPPAVPFGANLTGEVVATGARVGREMFVDQARRPVRFGAALAAIGRRFPDAVFVELGPGRTLTAAAAAIDRGAIPLSPSRTQNPETELRTALGALWVSGLPLSRAVLAGAGRPVHLPTYPFAGPRWLAPQLRPDGRPVPERSVPERPRPAFDTGTDAGEPDAYLLLTNAWAELLGQPELNESSDFFQLGGDSLLITHLARRVNRELGVEVPLRTMLASRTLGRQAAVVLDLLARRRTPASGAV